MTVSFMESGRLRTVHNVDRIEDAASNYVLKMQFSDTPVIVPITRKLTVERGE